MASALDDLRTELLRPVSGPSAEGVAPPAEFPSWLETARAAEQGTGPGGVFKLTGPNSASGAGLPPLSAHYGDSPVLGEDARAAILGVVLVPLYYSEWDDGEEVGKAADDILTALNEPDGPVAALLAQARDVGAAAERERIMEDLRRWADDAADMSLPAEEGTLRRAASRIATSSLIRSSQSSTRIKS